MRRAYPRSSMPDCNVRSNVTSPTNASVGNSTSPNAKNAPPTLVAVATSPKAINPPATDAKNMLARPVDSAIVAERAPCNVKCSVVMNETAEALGSLAALPESWSAPIAITPPAVVTTAGSWPLGERFRLVCARHDSRLRGGYAPDPRGTLRRRCARGSCRTRACIVLATEPVWPSSSGLGRTAHLPAQREVLERPRAHQIRRAHVWTPLT